MKNTNNSSISSGEVVTLYKYIKSERIKEILTNDYLFMNDGQYLNDPFELIVADRKTNEIRSIKNLHILCLTNSFQNKLLWSHYAESHKGACITVKVSKKWVHPLCYSSRRIYEDSNIDTILSMGNYQGKQNIPKPPLSLNINKKIAYIKDKKWSYEKEYRVVFDESDKENVIIKDNKWFLPIKIINIYIGIRCELSDEIKEICQQKNIKITRMSLSQTDYSVKITK